MFAGFSCLGFAFAAIVATPSRNNTQTEALAYYVFNGIGIFATLMASLPLQCTLSRCRVINAITFSAIATISFTTSVVFGILENYEVYEADVGVVPNGSALYFLAWVTAVCSALANAMLLTFASIALCHPTENCDKDAPAFCPNLEEGQKPRSRSLFPQIQVTHVVEDESPRKKMPKSRADIRRG